jgi:hypothetical protein
MVARLVKFAFKAPARAGRVHGRQLSSPYDVRFASPHALVASPEPCVWAQALVEGGDLSCEAETCRRCSRLAKDWSSCQ